MSSVIQFERQIAGALLANPSWYQSAQITPADFMDEASAMVFEEVGRCLAENIAADLFIIIDRLNNRTGRDHTDSCLLMARDAAPSEETLKTRSEVVKKQSGIRKAQAIAHELLNQLSEGNDQAIDSTISELMAIDKGQDKYEWTMHEAVVKAVEQIDYAYNNKDGGLIGLPTGLEDINQKMGGLHKSDLIILGARPAMGKAQPLYSKVLLADGTWKKMGDIRLGDWLASVDGSPSEVVGIYPQGERDVYRVSFDSGEHVDCDLEHLWSVHSTRFKGEKVMALSEIIEKLKTERYKGRLKIARHTGDFGREINAGIDPWLMGFLIGDGCFKKGTVMFSTSEDYILDRVDSAIPEECLVRHKENYDYAVNCKGNGNVLLDVIRNLGLDQKKSYEKFIPEEFFSASRQQRLDLFSGLMESDGWVQDGSIQFSTSSKQLSDDFVKLVFSIGGKATQRVKKEPKYTHNGEMRIGRPAYISTVRLPEGFDFESPRLKNKITKRLDASRVITSVEKIGSDQVQCIEVTHKSHLYITDGYAVTHNTAVMLNLMIGSGVRCGVFSSEQGHDQIAQRAIAITGGVPVHAMRTGQLRDEHWSALMAGTKLLTDTNCLINDNPVITIHDIQRQSRKWARQDGVQMIFVDYAQRIKSAARHRDITALMGEVIPSLKSLARELDMPIVVLAQVKREVESRSDKRPLMGDLSDASIIEKEADQIIMLYRDEVYNPDTDLKGVIELIYEKNRHGPTGKICASWHGETLRVRNLTQDHWSAGNESKA